MTTKNYCQIILLSVFLTSTSAAEIYTWTDEYGKVHFSDRKNEGLDQTIIEVKPPKSQWKRFNIVVTDVDNILTEEEEKLIQNDVNNVYRFFDEKLYFDIHKTVPINIRLYKDTEDYKNYLTSIRKGVYHNSRGVYFSKENQIVVRLNTKERWRTFWTIKHETSHAIIDTLLPYAPVWLNEGVAENMEALGRDKQGFFLYPHTENFKSVQHAHKQNKLAPLGTFLHQGNKQWRQALRSGKSNYQSHTGELVRMLLSTNPGRDFLVRTLHLYKQGKRVYSHYIVDEYYIGGSYVLQNDFNRWIERSQSIRLLF